MTPTASLRLYAAFRVHVKSLRAQCGAEHFLGCVRSVFRTKNRLTERTKSTFNAASFSALTDELLAPVNRTSHSTSVI
jgi:hypothetical protein